jgi:hypothetical protein
MGYKIRSSSSYDCKVNKLTSAMREIWDDELPKQKKTTTFPNPNPKNFIIQRQIKIGKFFLLLVQYPDCLNHEGQKILVYYDISYKKLMNQKSLDPHFSNNKKFISPVARFEPTERGLKMAESFCKKYHE